MVRRQFGRLNTEEKGSFLGKFDPEDKLLVIYNDGNYEITDQELTQRFDADKILLIEKNDPGENCYCSISRRRKGSVYYKTF